MSYWEERLKKLHKLAEESEAEMMERLRRVYARESKALARNIAQYYAEYGVSNVIEYRVLLQTADPAFVELLIKDMNAFAEQYPEYAHLLPVRESVYKLDRMEALQESVRLQQLEIGAVENEMMASHLSFLGEEAAKAAEAVMGRSRMFHAYNEQIAKQFVDRAWVGGEDFSERIWANKEKLTQYLQQDLAQGFARGDSYQKLTKQLVQRMGDVSARDAYRLVYTEGTYVMAESSMEPFIQDFNQYKISIFGESACDLCKDMAEQVFAIKDRKAGINFPPFHPYCRCSFYIVEPEDWDAWIADYVARRMSTPEEAERILENL